MMELETTPEPEPKIRERWRWVLCGACNNPPYLVRWVNNHVKATCDFCNTVGYISLGDYVWFERNPSDKRTVRFPDPDPDDPNRDGGGDGAAEDSDVA